MNRVCIIHFNTPELTAALVKSIRKFSPGVCITVFDNSTLRPFIPMDGVEIIDNTRGQVINFDSFLSKFHHKRKTFNNWGGAKHARTVEKLISLFPDGFILIDGDALLKKDISPLFDDNYIAIGEVHTDIVSNTKIRPRLLPYLCWINSRLCSENDIHYFDKHRSWKLYPGDYTTWYDTGASFLEDCVKSGLPMKMIETEEYIEHLQGGSYKEKDWQRWLNQYSYLYES